ncbi:hypothetical protein CTEN210_06703 [Chaetoceros tenuissimus]|uniref:Uncharacterized protein n=1 Tax=Chaetoceros tenuissimus TaxID=426638 RepID=A0AAD3CQI3_9STRA|nr:hypothetical protein CTEN210_06703 [Chaetoceros tenuissimus]
MVEAIEKMYITQIVGATISLIASTTIVFVSRKAFLVFKKKRTPSTPANQPNEHHIKPEEMSVYTPYRRILIGLSLSDILQSLSLVVGPFIPPRDSPHGIWAVGSVATCETFGLFLYAASIASPLYSVMLTFYFLCKIKYKMSNEDFREKLEKKLYVLIIAFATVPGLIALLTDSINTFPNGSACHVSSIPIGCRDMPDVECVRGKEHVVGLIYTFLFTSMFSLCAVAVLMILICRHVLRQQSITSGNNESNGKWCRFCRLISIRTPKRDDNETETMFLSRIYLSEMLKQSFLYTLVYTTIFIFAWIVGILNIVGRPVPTWISYGLFWFYPFGGALNILVLTRPKIRALCINHPEFRWIQAFWLVLKAGVDMPDDGSILKAKGLEGVPAAEIRLEIEDASNISSIRNVSSLTHENKPVREIATDDTEYIFCCWGLWHTKINTHEMFSVSALSSPNVYSGVSIVRRNQTSLRAGQDVSREVIEEESNDHIGEEHALSDDDLSKYSRILNMIDGDDGGDDDIYFRLGF